MPIPLLTNVVTVLVLSPATADAIAVPCPLAPWHAEQFVAYTVAPFGPGAGVGVGVGVGVGPGVGVGVGPGVGVGVGVGTGEPRFATYAARTAISASLT